LSNYTKSTNFATKDALVSGNALKIVKGTEIDTEFNNIQTAVATKADLASPTFTGTVTIPTVAISAGTITGITDLTVADGGTGASTAANARTNLSAASSGANSDITSLTGLTTALSVPQGGTGATSFTSGSLLKGVGTSAVTVASGSDIVTAIGATAVQSATSATSLSTASGSAPSYSARAWATLTIASNGGAVTIAANGNVASVSHSSAGVFFVTFTTAMPDADYSVNISCGLALGNTSSPLVQLFSNGTVGNFTAPTAAGFGFITMHSGNLSVQDCARICISVFR